MHISTHNTAATQACIVIAQELESAAPQGPQQDNTPSQHAQHPYQSASANSPAPSKALPLTAGKTSSVSRSRLRLQRPPIQKLVSPTPSQAGGNPHRLEPSVAHSAPVADAPSLPNMAGISAEQDCTNAPQHLESVCMKRDGGLLPADSLKPSNSVQMSKGNALQHTAVPDEDAVDLVSPSPTHAAAIRQSRGAEMSRPSDHAEVYGNMQKDAAVAAAEQRQMVKGMDMDEPPVKAAGYMFRSHSEVSYLQYQRVRRACCMACPWICPQMCPGLVLNIAL